MPIIKENIKESRVSRRKQEKSKNLRIELIDMRVIITWKDKIFSVIAFCGFIRGNI